MITMTTLRTLRIDLGWTTRKLAEEAGLPFNTAKRAEAGQPIYAHNAKKIADALSRAYGKKIKPSEIEGLVIH